MKKHLLALAATALLAACGGGADESTSTPATPAAAVDSLRTTLAAMRVQAITPESSAEQLLDKGESAYPMYFPGHKTTATFAPFRFRYYPETGVYLGVVVTAGMGFTMNGVYVMGGPFGSSPVYVGLVTDFITPVDPNPTPTGPNNGCYDLALLESTGTRIVANYQHSGSATGTQTVDTLVNGPKSFEGHQAIESTIKTTGTLTIEGQSNTTNIELKGYANRTADAEVTQYGAESTMIASIAGFQMTTTSKTVYNPPFADRSYGLSIGQSMTQNSTATITTTTTGIPGMPPTPQTTTSNVTMTTKFVGRESVTVPAKTYNACKFETTIAGVPNAVTTMWVVDGKGIMVKMQTTDGSAIVSKQEATSVTLNGQPL